MHSQSSKLPAVPNVKEATKLATPIIDQARELKISDDDSYIASWALIERHDAAIAKVGEWFDPLYRLASASQNGRRTARSVSRSIARIEESTSRRTETASHRARSRGTKETRRRRRDPSQTASRRSPEGSEENRKKPATSRRPTVLREQAATLPAPIMPVAPAMPKQTGSVEKTRWIADGEGLRSRTIEYKTLDHTKKTERALIDSKIQGVVAKLGTSDQDRRVDILQDSSSIRGRCGDEAHHL